MSVLHELYRGEIRPEEQYKPLLKELAQARKAFAKQREHLYHKLNEELRMEMEELLQVYTEISACEMEAAYVRGMRMGAKMTAALLGETDFSKAD